MLTHKEEIQTSAGRQNAPKIKAQVDHLFNPSLASLETNHDIKEICEKATWRCCDAQSAMDLPSIMMFAKHVKDLPMDSPWTHAGKAWQTCLLLNGELYEHKSQTFRILHGGGARQGATLAWLMKPTKVTLKDTSAGWIWSHDLKIEDIHWLT